MFLKFVCVVLVKTTERTRGKKIENSYPCPHIQCLNWNTYNNWLRDTQASYDGVWKILEYSMWLVGPARLLEEERTC